MNKENCALNLVDEIILYYDVRSKNHQNPFRSLLRYQKTSKQFRVNSLNFFIMTS